MAKDKKLKKLQELQERYEEVSDYLTNLLDDYRQQEEEIRYLREYINYKNLEEEFIYFQENAHEVYDENLPFPYLTL